MDYYANPPIMVVEFDKNIRDVENDMPSSPLGSPPSTPLHQPSLFFTAEKNTPTPTSSTHQSGIKRNGGSGQAQHVLQPTDDEDIPMDERRHIQGRSGFPSMDEDGPDDERSARHTMTTSSPSSNMRIASSPSPPRNRVQSMSPSKRLAYNRSNSGRTQSGETNNTNGLSRNGSVKNMVSKFETSPMMNTPEKQDLLSPPKLLLKKSDLWLDSPPTGGRLPPSSAKRPTTRNNRSGFQRSMADDEDIPHDERPSVSEPTGSDIPEDERMAMVSTSESAAAKARFARSTTRHGKQQPNPKSSNNIGLTTSLSSSSEPSVFAGELAKRLEASQPRYEREEGDELLPTSKPMNSARHGVVDRNSPRRPAPRRLDYDNSDTKESLPGRDDNVRSRAEKLRRLRLAEAQQQDEQEAAGISKRTSPSIVPLYPARVSVSVAAALKRTLLHVPMVDSLWDLKSKDLVKVLSLESFVGIAKGDLTICLLPHHESNEPSNGADKGIASADRVQAAIGIRQRSLKHMGGIDIGLAPVSSASPLRPMQPVDGDDVLGMHHAALSHLLVNDIDRAIGCYREISSLYKIQKDESKRTPLSPRNESETNFELCRSLVLHYLGILNLLKKKHFTAMTYFSNALEIRMSCLVEGHPQQVVSYCVFHIMS